MQIFCPVGTGRKQAWRPGQNFQTNLLQCENFSKAFGDIVHADNSASFAGSRRNVLFIAKITSTIFWPNYD